MSRPVNFYDVIGKSDQPDEKNPNYHIHGIKVPFRMLIVGASGSMKTNTALDIFLKFSPTFVHLTIVTRNSNEPLYMLIRQKIPPSQLKIIEIEEDDLSDLPTMGKLKSDEPHTLVIFDDLVLVKNQKMITEYFIRARKFNISCMYLTQSYFQCIKTIRGNCNIIVLKKIASLSDLRMILRDYSLALTLDELQEIYLKCTRDKLDWLSIMTENPPEKQFYHSYTAIDISSDRMDTEKSFSGNPRPDTPIRPRPSRELHRPDSDELCRSDSDELQSGNVIKSQENGSVSKTLRRIKLHW